MRLLNLAIDDLFMDLVVWLCRLPGRILLWPVSIVVRILPRHFESLELTLGLVLWVAVSLWFTVL